MITLQDTAVHTIRLRTESRTEYSCSASGAPGRSSSWNRRSASSRCARLRSR
jgi:hypothetical protein